MGTNNHSWRRHSAPTCCLKNVKLNPFSESGDTETLGVSARDPPGGIPTLLFHHSCRADIHAV